MLPGLETPGAGQVRFQEDCASMHIGPYQEGHPAWPTARCVVEVRELFGQTGETLPQRWMVQGPPDTSMGVGTQLEDPSGQIIQDVPYL